MISYVSIIIIIRFLFTQNIFLILIIYLLKLFLFILKYL